MDNPARIASRLEQIATEMGSLAPRWAKAASEYATAKRNYEKANAQAFIEAEGSVEHRKAQATLATHDERIKLAKIEGQLEGSKAFHRALSDEGGFLQSLLAKERDEEKFEKFMPRQRGGLE